MPRKIYPYPVEPEKYEAFARRPNRAVTREALGNRIQFTSLRGFPAEADDAIRVADTGMHPPLAEGGRLAYLEETIDMYVNHFKLGRVLWPVYPTLFAGNFGELVDICAREGLFLYDFWGFVPGSNPSAESIWGEYAIPESADRIMREKLGERFLGYDNGEQDGRYIGARSRSQASIIDDRKAQYDVFQAYFAKLNDSMLNHTVTLSSLTFLPYFAKEGNTIMIGAETAQALPSNTMWFSFIRGAAKQYGLLYYGNASVWNRWGWKDYGNMEREPVTTTGAEMGRFCGTSLSLLKRLIYNHYMYGCDILGFESSWFTAREAKKDDVTDDTKYVIGNKCHVFTPVGRIQQKCAEFVEKNGRAGVLHTPVALMLDFHAGWLPPRHLYTNDIYKAWGSLPYSEGDHQVHCIMDMLFPGYEDAGFYRDERGFETPTPYGEIMDVLMSDAAPEILARYPAIVLTNGIDLNLELQNNLRKYVENGGTLVAFEGLIQGSGLEAFFGEKHANGKTVLIPQATGLEPTGEALTADNRPNEPICRPYRLTKDARAALDEVFRGEQLLYIDNLALGYATSVRSRGEYTFMVTSPAAQRERFDILSAIGEITFIEELETFDGAEREEEFLPLMRAPEGKPARDTGNFSIDAGCVRIFRVKVGHPDTAELPESNTQKRTARRWLKLPVCHKSMRRAMLDNPTFSRHFDGFYISARYLETMDYDAAKREAHYMKLQGASVIADFSEMINHYPDLALVGNIPARDAESLSRIEKILDKAALYDCEAVLVCAERRPENEYTQAQTEAGFLRALAQIADMCKERGFKLLYRNRTLYTMPIEEQAFDTASGIFEGRSEIPETAQYVLASSPHRDMFGQLYPMNLPLHKGLVPEAWKARLRDTALVLSADYQSWDEVIADLQWLEA
ncbi:MAG: hypothetical protein ACOYI8_00060 [Christensenellales bacterium]|jgi:hypothetical protein